MARRGRSRASATTPGRAGSDVRRADRRWLALALLLTAACALPQLGGPIDARSDGAVYYILGTSLGEAEKAAVAGGTAMKLFGLSR